MNNRLIKSHRLKIQISFKTGRSELILDIFRRSMVVRQINAQRHADGKLHHKINQL